MCFVIQIDPVTFKFAFHAIPNPEKSLRQVSRALKTPRKISASTTSVPTLLPEGKTIALVKKRHLNHRHLKTQELRQMLRRNKLMDMEAKRYGAFLLAEAWKIKPPNHIIYQTLSGDRPKFF